VHEVTGRKVSIVEVGPRDGLQNEPVFVPTAEKLRLIERLADTGLKRIEATAFVSPKWVPQMADHADVMRQAHRRSGLTLSALVPNDRGAEAALAAGAQELAVFVSASETFSRKNTNCTIEDALSRFVPVIARAAAVGIRVRGYVSCALDCPYEGPIAPADVANVSEKLHTLGCFEIAVSDTLGNGTPERTHLMVTAVAKRVPVDQLAGHFHDTGTRALLNVQAALALGVNVFDGAVGGLGGCPFAPGAAGNIATEKLVDWLSAQGFRIDVDLEKLKQVANMAKAFKH
jgi:hydroxymethylglutaryl-CoA lyase